MGWVVVCHAGAGFHAEKKALKYQKVLNEACKAASNILSQEGSGLDACEAALRVLEASPLTNAGLGSNLTRLGTVELDACVMDGSDGLFGAVGAVPGVAHPSSVAKHLLLQQKQGLTPEGLEPPNFLVGEGARQWAEQQGVDCGLCSGQSLVSSSALKTWETYMKRTGLNFPPNTTSISSSFASSSTSSSASSASTSFSSSTSNSDRSTLPCASSSSHTAGPDEQAGEVETSSEEADVGNSSMFYDTVGVVALDSSGNVAAGVSSGGIWLKYPGRVGEAAVFGAGCWAVSPKQTSPSPSLSSSSSHHSLYSFPSPVSSSPSYIGGCSVSGTGEHISRTLLARTCMQEAIKSFSSTGTQRGRSGERRNGGTFGMEEGESTSRKGVNVEESVSVGEEEQEEGVEESVGVGMCEVEEGCLHERMGEVLTDLFIRPSHVSSPKYAGIVMALVPPSLDNAELFWWHSTPSMAIGFCSSSQPKPQSFISRLDKKDMAGYVSNSGGTVVRL